MYSTHVVGSDSVAVECGIQIHKLKLNKICIGDILGYIYIYISINYWC